ncbi:hypothetical protein ACHAWF_017696 [Thalassiosira exigua]
MPAKTRRQTIAPSSKPPAAGGGGGGGSVGGNGSRRAPKARKSMLPRCAGSSSSASHAPSSAASANASNAERENNGRSARPSGLAAPSPSRARPRPPASRKSMGPVAAAAGGGGGRPSAAAAPIAARSPARNRRVSLAPPSSSRDSLARSSARPPSSSTTTTHGGVGGGVASSSNVDPRDVKDRSYLHAAVAKMVSYLKDNGYPDAPSLSVRQLVNGPSGRDFQNVMTFLLRRIDLTFYRIPPRDGRRSDEPPPKFEDEVSSAFRTLGYPFPVSKTGLVAVGSPHTWPALVAAIDWLVDLLAIVDDEVPREWEEEDTLERREEELSTLEGSAARIERQYYAYLRKSMRAFLDDDNEGCEALEVALQDEYGRDHDAVEANLTELDEDIGRMQVEMAGLGEEVEGLAEAQQKQEENAGNIEKFMKLIEQLTEHKAELTNKVETLAAEKAETEREMADCSKKIERLRETIDGQELSQEDIAKQKKVLEGAEAALKEARERRAAVHRLLEEHANEYNAKARQLGLVPKGAKHAGGRDFEVRLDEGRAAEGEAALLGGVDVRGAVQPRVRELVRKYESEAAKEKRRMAEVKAQIGSATINEARLREDVAVSLYSVCQGRLHLLLTRPHLAKIIGNMKAIIGKIASCKEEGERQKAKLEAEIKDKRRQLKILGTKISSIDDPEGVEAALRKIESECERLEAQRQKQAKEIEAEKKAVNDEVRRALELAKEYKDHKEKKLAELNAYIEKKKEECDNIKLLES